MKLTFLGAPGAGKGTQAAVVAQKLGIPTISTGNMLREAVEAQTEVGLKAKAFMESGGLVPDDVIIGILDERLRKDDCRKGFILDGVPRTVAQAEALETRGIKLDCVVSLEVDDEDIKRRMSGRRVCLKCGATYHVTDNPSKDGVTCDVCGDKLVQRADDAPETVASRLAVYHEKTEPLKNFYAGLGTLKTVKADVSIDEVTKAVFAALGI
ncbi:MAG: adenylate kinase [Oscillospiraceae bacterium]|nr:adenylate kinase [Oscillospiraceae bacterium]